MLQALCLQELEAPIQNAADRNRTSADIQKPHRKGDCATSADSCTRFVQLHFLLLFISIISSFFL